MDTKPIPSFQAINEQYVMFKLEAEVFKVSLQVNDMLLDTFHIQSVPTPQLNPQHPIIPGNNNNNNNSNYKDMDDETALLRTLHRMKII